jgi:hypothetical protein
MVSMKINTLDFVAKLYAGQSMATVSAMQEQVGAIETAGWGFTFNMFMVTISKGNVNVQDNFPSLIPHLMSGSLSSKELLLCRGVFTSLLAKVAEHQQLPKFDPSATVPIPGLGAQADKMDKAAIKKAIANNEYGHATAAEAVIAAKGIEEAIVDMNKLAQASAVPKKAKVMTGVMPKGKPQRLVDATVLNEIVLGTTEGNLYRTVALGDLKVAVRPNSAGVAIRIEGNFTEQVVKRLQAMGFSKKPDYMSMHCQLNAGMPASRVVGAVLWSMEVPFTQMITNGKDIA